MLGKNGLVYAAPDLVIHYIINHQYLPPKEFIDAVMNGPKPGGEEYRDMVKGMYEYIHKYVYKHEHKVNDECPYCGSNSLSYQYTVKKNINYENKIVVVDRNEVSEAYHKDDVFYSICQRCGRMFEAKVLKSKNEEMERRLRKMQNNGE
ncbi:MAG: hypothetical protein II919_02960 [Lachnospiraceae bacterium]|nr:hypothetical protein [Lachnospiraceae bacterium]